MKSVQGALITIVVVIVVAVGVVLIVVTNVDNPLKASSSMPYRVTTSTTHPTAYDEGATRGGDAAPHEQENRGYLRPGDLTDEAQQRLDAIGASLTPTLEQVRASGAITPEAVRGALLTAGYPEQDVEAVPRTLPSDGTTQYVVFGIAFQDGCVSGIVTPTEVRAEAMGRYPEWGCIAPDTH
jgi:hypothetical protein